MIVFTLYLGNNDKYISHFKSLLKKDIYFAISYLQAEEIISKNAGALPVMVLCEKHSATKDAVCISYIKSKFPRAYMVLVTESLDKVDIVEYHRMGINDTIPPDVSVERLTNGMNFVARNQELIVSTTQESLPLGVYHCPLWKRLFDIVFGVAALIVLLPLLIIVAAAIVIESKGEIVYKSKRVGSNYNVFDFYKFRSMYKDADKRLKEFMSMNQYREGDPDSYYDYNDEMTIPVTEADTSDNFFVSDDQVFSESLFLKEKNMKNRNNFIKYENDPRITRVGRFLRKFSIDELPQLINIIKGDMSIVGNRPLPLYEAEKLTSDQYIDRFLGPSGLTGLWQVEKRGDSGSLSPEERKQLDIYYAKNFSFLMDVKIILKTFTAFIQKENV